MAWGQAGGAVFKLVLPGVPPNSLHPQPPKILSFRCLATLPPAPPLCKVDLYGARPFRDSFLSSASPRQHCKNGGRGSRRLRKHLKLVTWGVEGTQNGFAFLSSIGPGSKHVLLQDRIKYIAAFKEKPQPLGLNMFFCKKG